MNEATAEAERLRLCLLIWQGTLSHFLGQYQRRTGGWETAWHDWMS